MYAEVGDRIVLHARGGDRSGEVIDSRQPGGRPPYLVRWDHDASEVILFPSDEASFIPAVHDGAA